MTRSTLYPAPLKFEEAVSHLLKIKPEPKGQEGETQAEDE